MSEPELMTDEQLGIALYDMMYSTSPTRKSVARYLVDQHIATLQAKLVEAERGGRRLPFCHFQRRSEVTLDDLRPVLNFKPWHQKEPE